MKINMNALELITKRLGGNMGLAEDAIQLIEKYVDFNGIEKEFAFDPDEKYWKEVCDGEMSDISDRLSDADRYIYHCFEEYFENIEHTSVLRGLGDCLLIYMKSKKRAIKESKTNKNMKKNIVKLNENTLRKIVAESIKNVLNEEYDGNYLQLVKEEMHRLFELSLKVPERIRPEIYGMATSLQSILEDAKRNDEFDNWNN